MSDEKTPADIELEQTVRSIRSVGESKDTVDDDEGTESTQDD
jgi:hypothetical protein